MNLKARETEIVTIISITETSVSSFGGRGIQTVHSASRNLKRCRVGDGMFPNQGYRNVFAAIWSTLCCKNEKLI